MDVAKCHICRIEFNHSIPIRHHKGRLDTTQQPPLVQMEPCRIQQIDLVDPSFMDVQQAPTVG